MANLKFNVLCREEQEIYGLWKQSNDRSISKDLKRLSKQYRSIDVL